MCVCACTHTHTVRSCSSILSFSVYNIVLIVAALYSTPFALEREMKSYSRRRKTVKRKWKERKRLGWRKGGRLVGGEGGTLNKPWGYISIPVVEL